MFLIWFIAGFVLCLFMPASVQMVVKTIISKLYNIVRAWFDKNGKDIRY